MNRNEFVVRLCLLSSDFVLFVLFAVSVMAGIPDTLIEIRAGAPEAEEIAEAERDIRSLYPPESARPDFSLTDVVERDGKKFVRLSTMAGSLHLWLRRSVKLRAFPRAILAARDKDIGEYEYLS